MATTTFDPTKWQDDLDALIAQLPDASLADQLKTDAAARMRAWIKRGNNASVTSLSAYEILTTDWPEPNWSIPGILPTGLNFLAGKSKVGKSWLALQIARAVATGGEVLGQQVARGNVWYLALEDNPRRLRNRMEKQGWPVDQNLPVKFTNLRDFLNEVGYLHQGGADILARDIEREGYTLVIVDTLSRAFGKAKQDDVSEMTDALSPVQLISFDHGCTTLVADHFNKASGGDVLDVVNDLLGSTGKGAVADTIIGLYRERGKIGAKLAMTGRDIDERTLALEMDWSVGCWQLIGDDDAIQATKAEQEILDALDDLGKAKCTEIARAIGKDRGNVYKTLQNLVNKTLVERDNNYYSINHTGNPFVNPAP